MGDHAISEENCGFQKGTGGNPKRGGDPPPLASCVASRPRRNGAPISLPGRLAQRKPDGHAAFPPRSEEHTSELQSRFDLVCRLLLEKKKSMQYRAGCSVCIGTLTPSGTATGDQT